METTNTAQTLDRQSAYILSQFVTDLQNIANRYSIDWQQLVDCIAVDGVINPNAQPLNSQSNPAYQGKVFVEIAQQRTRDGLFPLVYFKTFAHGKVIRVWKGFNAWQKLSASKDLKKKTDRFQTFHDLFQNLPQETGSHPYLVAKFGILAPAVASLMDLRRGQDWLGEFIAYSLINKSGKVVGYQKIYDRHILGRGDNKDFVFLPNEFKGSYHLIGEYVAGKPLFIAEGLSTALTDCIAKGVPCVISLSAGNLDAVVSNLKDLGYQKLVLTADNDQKDLLKNGNTGLYKAVQTMRKHGGRVFLPITAEGLEQAKLADRSVFDVTKEEVLSASGEACNFDFNDLLQRSGIDAVKEQLKLSSNYCEVKLAEKSLERLLQDLPIMPKHDRKHTSKRLVREMVRKAPFVPLTATKKQIEQYLPAYVPVDFSDVERLYALKKAEAVRLFTFTEKLPVFDLGKDNDDKAIWYLLKNGGVYIDNRPMGAGKTKLMAKIAQFAKEMGLTFAYIAHRVSLIANACKRLNIDNYEQLLGYMMHDVEELGLCINSAEKEHFRVFLESVDVLCIDEIRQVLEHIAVGSVDKAHRELLHNILLHVICNAKLVIGSDADMDQKTINFLKSVNRPMMKLADNKTYKVGAIIQPAHYLTVWQEAINTALKGKKTLIQCDSIKETEALPKEIENITIELKKQGLKVLVVNSETRPEPEQAEFLKDPDAYLLKHNIDVLITSPTISSGFSIEIDYFEAHYMLMQGVITPTEITQTAGRNRCSKVIRIGFEDNHIHQAVSEEQLLIGNLQVANRLNFARNEVGHFTEISYKLSEFDKFAHGIRVQIEESRIDYINKTLLIFEAKGNPIEYPEQPDNDPNDTTAKDRKTASATAEKERGDLVHQAPVIESQEAKQLEKSNNLRLHDRYKLEKYQLTEQLAVDEPSRDDVTFWNRGKGMEKIKAFETMQAKPSDCMAYDKRQHETIKSISIMTKATSKNALYDLVFETLGIDKHTGQGQFKQEQAVIALKLLQSHNEECIVTKLGNFTRINEKYAVRSIGKLLVKMGLKLQASGHHDRSYSIDAESWAVMQGYVNARRRRGLNALKLADRTVSCLTPRTFLSASYGQYRKVA